MAQNLIRYSSDLTNPLWAYNNAFGAKLVSTTSPTGAINRFGPTGTETPDPTQWVSQLNLPEYSPLTAFTLALWIEAESAATQALLLQLTSGVNQDGVALALDAVTTTTHTPHYTSGGVLDAASSWTGLASLDTAAGAWRTLWVTGTTPADVNQTLSVKLSTLAGAPAPQGFSCLIGGLALYQGAYPATPPPFVATTVSPAGNEFLETFSFPVHTTATRYPDNSVRAQFNQSYVFSSAPVGPPQRMFTLHFEGLVFYFDSNGAVDGVTNPTNNAWTLEQMYQRVQLYKAFWYPHPIYGAIKVRFNKPLELPFPKEGGSGYLNPVDLELIEAP